MNKLLVTLTKGYQARSDSGEGNIPYASIKDVSNFLLETNEFTDKNIDELIFAKPNSVVLAITGATIGKAGINATSQNIAISGDLVCIESQYKNIPSHYLLIVLSSTMLQLLCQRYTSGRTNGHLSIYDVADFPIPIISNYAISSITNKVISAIESREQSKQLLEIAKTGVEKAIEDNEEKAINWINQQLKNLEIDYFPPLKMTTKGD